MREILDPAAGARLKPIWGLDAEGEIQGAWRDIGLPNLWCMMGKPFSFSGGENYDAQLNVGNFALCRFHSKHVALRTFLSDELIRTHLFRVPADNSIFFLLQKLKQSRHIRSMGRDIARRHLWDEKGLRIPRYAVAGLGMISRHVVQ
jgi:hypothetical protein